jgi:hypothetical protein
MIRTTHHLLGLAIAAGILAGCAKADKPVVATEPAPENPPAEISIPGTGIFPESLAASADGTVYIGSAGRGQVYRARPGSAIAESFMNSMAWSR